MSQTDELDYYRQWRERTKTYPQTDIDVVMNDLTVSLPECCQCYIVANNEEEVISFIKRFETLNAWVQQRIIDDVVFDDGFDDLDADEKWDTIRRISVGPFGSDGLTICVTETSVRVNDAPVALTNDAREYVQYPCVVMYLYDNTADRAGDLEINSCAILNLGQIAPRQGDPVVHTEWINQ